MRFFFPLILIGAAIGLFALYTNPTYQGEGGIKELQTQVGAFDQALTKANDLKRERDKLLSKRNTFSTENVQKLEQMLPDHVDNIRLIIDINNVAARRGLTLKNVSLGTISDSKTTRSTVAVGASGDPVGSVSVSFGLSTTYEDFLLFLQDLEHSLRIVDVEHINFKSAANQNYDIGLTIRTYWLH